MGVLDGSRYEGLADACRRYSRKDSDTAERMLSTLSLAGQARYRAVYDIEAEPVEPVEAKRVAELAGQLVAEMGAAITPATIGKSGPGCPATP